MREIKFRVWDEKNNIMRQVDELCLENKEVSYGTEVLLWHNFEDIKLMQFTGLKDKNVKEIYEGDIIKAKVNNNKPIIEEVRWAEYRWYPFGQAVPPNYTGAIIEVIGNIHENPELLKEGNV